tara:strand:+ start:1649 stop:1918 length:270 start_codon:yes stop_codon:yes gene_type:complete
MEDLLKNVVTQAVDSATTEIVEGVIVETIETTEIPTEDLAWEVADIIVDTGAGDALIALTGGPVVLVLAYKVFKKWRKGIREKQMMGKS